MIFILTGILIGKQFGQKKKKLGGNLKGDSRRIKYEEGNNSNIEHHKIINKKKWIKIGTEFVKTETLKACYAHYYTVLLYYVYNKMHQGKSWDIFLLYISNLIYTISTLQKSLLSINLNYITYSNHPLLLLTKS